MELSSKVVKSIKGIKGILGNFLGDDDDAAEQTHDSSYAAPPPNKDLPPISFFFPETSPPPAAPIESLSPERHRTIFEDASLLESNAPPRLGHHSSDDNRRKSSGSTPVPNPKLGFAPAMGKPPAKNSFQPINTLSGNSHDIVDRINPNRSRGKPTTYGKVHRNPGGSIGYEQHYGQQEFLKRYPNHKPMPSTEYGLSPTSPAKRLKIGHAVEEVVDEDDEVEDVTPVPPHAPIQRAQSIVSSQSLHSTSSRPSVTKPTQPRSEFQDTDDNLNPRRKRNPRRKVTNGARNSRNASPFNVPPVKVGSLSRDGSIEYPDNGPVQLSRTASPPIDRYEQGVNYTSEYRERPQVHNARVTSQHFTSKMRINENTDADVQLLDEGRGGLHTVKALSEHRPAHSFELKNDPVEGSEDELAQPLAHPLELRRGKTVKTPAQVRKVGKKSTKTAARYFELRSARTYEFELCGPHLSLRQDINDLKAFRITGLDDRDYVNTLRSFTLDKVTHIESDNSTRMRLLGPLTDGIRCWYDFEFSNSPDFIEFRDKHIYPEVLQKKIKPQDFMIKLFKRPFEKNGKLSKSAVMIEEPPSSTNRSEQSTASRAPLVSKMLGSSRGDSNFAVPDRDGIRQFPSTSRAPTRTARSTRATAPVHDQHNPDVEVDKYSKTFGLGRPWTKPLEFTLSEGLRKRRSSTINFDDLERLDEDEMLNDNLIDFYMMYLFDRLEVPKDQVYFFNTYFYSRLTNVKGQKIIDYEAVKSWTKREDIFGYDYIVVPINEGYHWYLAIICNVSNIARKPVISDLEDGTPGTKQPTACALTDGAAEHYTDVTSKQQQPSEGPMDLKLIEGANVKKITDDEDLNLFEEEKKLSLIDRDDEGVELDGHMQSALDQHSPQDEAAATTTTLTQSGDVPLNLLSNLPPSSQKKKGRRKPPIAKRDPTKPVIMVLDSLAVARGNATRALKEWLKAEGLERRGMNAEIKENGYYPKPTQIPTQSNQTDCGLYVLGYAQEFFKDPEGFKTRLLKGEMSAETDWPDMQPSIMRTNLRQLLLRLHTEQTLAAKEAHKAKKATNTKSAPGSPTKAKQNITTQLNLTNKGTPDTMQAEPVRETSAGTVQMNLNAESALSPRRLSPISPKTPAKDVQPEAPENLRSGSIAQDLPNQTKAAVASAHTSPAHPKQTPGRRLGNSEVRIPIESPHNAPPSMRYDNATQRSQKSAQQPTNSTSPLQKPSVREPDEDKLKKPSAKNGQASTSVRQAYEVSPSSTRLKSRIRSGGHDDPIMLDNSQEAEKTSQERYTLKKSPSIIALDHSQVSACTPSAWTKVANDGSPVQRKSHYRSLQREPSVQEIPSFDLKAGFSADWEGGQDLTRALKASLDELDGHRNTDCQPESHFQLPNSVVKDWDNVPELYSESSKTMDAMDVDERFEDSEVAETPERQRSSPGVADEMEWQAGNTLPA